MKLGIHTHAWGGHFGGDTLYIIDRCKQLGMDFIEFPLMEIDAFDPVAVKARLEGAIEPTCSTIIPDPHWDIGSEDPACRQLGIDLGIEPASRFSNHLVNTTGQGLDFLAEVDEPNTILHLDSFHMCYEGGRHRAHLLHHHPRSPLGHRL